MLFFVKREATVGLGDDVQEAQKNLGSHACGPEAFHQGEDAGGDAARVVDGASPVKA
jgi:hypothetical protein